MDDVELLFAFKKKNAEQVESCLKTQLKTTQYKQCKEVYEVDLNVIKSIIRDCDQLTLKSIKRISSGSQISGGYYMMFPEKQI